MNFAIRSIIMRRRDFIKLIAIAFGTGIEGNAMAEVIRNASDVSFEKKDDHIKDYFQKMKHFDSNDESDFYLTDTSFKLLESTVLRLRRIQRTIGYGNYNLLGFDEAIKIARNYTRVGQFTKDELRFLEMIFYEDAAMYGFNGQKPLGNLTDRVKRNKSVKIPHSGNYLYKGLPEETFRKIKKDVGEELILTSGIRGITKQLYLFLNKAYRSKGNLSLASRSLAPPGYSFHGIGDFDVGQVNFGRANFTERFTTTKVFLKLRDLGYIKLRYEKGNMLGVRYEPWHIKLLS